MKYFRKGTGSYLPGNPPTSQHPLSQVSPFLSCQSISSPQWLGDDELERKVYSLWWYLVLAEQ